MNIKNKKEKIIFSIGLTCAVALWVYVIVYIILAASGSL